MTNYLKHRDRITWTRSGADAATYHRAIFNSETGEPSTESGSYSLSGLKADLLQAQELVATLAAMVEDIEAVKAPEPMVEPEIATEPVIPSVL